MASSDPQAWGSLYGSANTNEDLGIVIISIVVNTFIIK